MDQQPEFLSLSTIYCGQTRVDNHLTIFYTTYPRVDDSLPLIVIYWSLTKREDKAVVY